MFNQKRAQITPFIVMGLIIVLLLYILINASLEQRKQIATEEEREAAERLPPIDIYINNCIEQESIPSIVLLGRQGGLIKQKESDFLQYHEENLTYLCFSQGIDSSFACVNSLLARQEMERDLEDEIKKRLFSCINLNSFRYQGLMIEEQGNLDVEVTIARDDVVVDVNYPLRVNSSEGVITDISRFTKRINLPLGRLYTLALEITNKEISKGTFDQTEWMKKNGAGTLIQKHKPYPDTLYVLNKNNYTFQFALQGSPTVAQRISEKEIFYGCCINSYDNSCFKHADPVLCTGIDGQYSSNENCECGFIEQEVYLCNGKPCSDCEDVGKDNGESWCMYDGIVGKGYDQVGSRHYRQSCINGEVFTEECRGYREELCTESADSSGDLQAECRINRWYDCSECTSESCCSDSRYRDCYWNKELTTDNKCVAQVPPGLRFWNFEGVDVCLKANDEKKCDGWSCLNDWIDSSARYCYSQGDCGNYRNVEGRLTTSGFFETDVHDKPRDNIYLPSSWTSNPLPDGSFWRLNLPLDATSNPSFFSKTQQSPVGNLPTIMASAFNFLDKVSSINPSDYLNPFKKNQDVNVVDFTFCSVWNAPSGSDDCSLCDIDPLRPCTEYLCKSLGESCQFEIEKGIPLCSLPQSGDSKAPTIQFIEETLPVGYSSKKVTMSGNKGYQITPALKPHRPFTIGIKTNEETRCTMSLGPRIDKYRLPTIWLGDNSYAIEHNISLRVPPQVTMPTKFLDFLDFSSTSGFIDLLGDLKNKYEFYKNKFKKELKIYKAVEGEDLLGDLDPAITNVTERMESLSPYAKGVVDDLIEQFDNQGYFLFMHCVDRAGNENEDEFFVKFSIDDNLNDAEAPIIVASDPKTLTKIPASADIQNLKIYVDEPAECRYDYGDMSYEDMGNNFNCPLSQFSISPVEGGTYECSADVKLPFDLTKIFVRCRDNPLPIERYSLKLSAGHNFSINKTGTLDLNAGNISEYVITKPAHVIDVSSSMIDDLTFMINTSVFDINLYLPEMKDCKYTNDSSIPFDEIEDEFEFRVCDVSDDVKKGMYSCGAEIKIDETWLEKSMENRAALVPSDEIIMELDYSILCNNLQVKNRNTNAESYVVSLEKVGELNIIEKGPEGVIDITYPELKIRVTEDIVRDGVSCGYSDMPSGFINMDHTGVREFTAQIPEVVKDEEYVYYFKCTDQYGAEIDDNVNFKYLG